jgi:hypothetical protein
VNVVFAIVLPSSDAMTEHCGIKPELHETSNTFLIILHPPYDTASSRPTGGVLDR